jgi:hypothetical protein
VATSPRLDAAYAAQVKAIRARVEAFALARFAAGQHRDADLARFVASVVPVVLAGRRQVSALTDSYLSRMLGTTPLGPIDTDALRGVDAREVYARPFVTVRTKLSQGMAYDAAVAAGAARLTDIALADMQLAKTHTSRGLYQRAGVTRYARTLTGTINCALCTIASTQTYSSADLLPIHPGCDCGTRPVAAGDRSRMDADLTRTHEAVEDRLGASDSGGRAPDYRKQLIVQEHGELGPLLAVRGQHFQGASVMDAN